MYIQKTPNFCWAKHSTPTLSTLGKDLSPLRHHPPLHAWRAGIAVKEGCSEDLLPDDERGPTCWNVQMKRVASVAEVPTKKGKNQ